MSNELLKANIMRRMTELVPVMNKLVADIESLPARDRIEVEEKIDALIGAFHQDDSLDVRTS